MKYRDNEIIVIQTSDSSNIIITKDSFPYDDADIESIFYSIREGDNPVYWSDCWHTDIQTVINLIEFPPKNVSCKRDFISWWLNCRPLFVDEKIKPLLKHRLELYHLTGEIKSTFQNANLGLEFNSDCLLEWHKLLEVDYKEELNNLKSPDENSWYKEINMISIQFEGFQTLPYRAILLKFDFSLNLQLFLDHLYECIKKEIPAFSYGEKWILFNSTGGFVLPKGNNSNRTLTELGIKENDKIVCYKHNYI